MTAIHPAWHRIHYRVHPVPDAATTVTGAFRRDYGGSAGCPDFAVAVMTVVRGLQSETEPGPRSLLSLTLRASRLFFAAEVRWRNS